MLSFSVSQALSHLACFGKALIPDRYIDIFQGRAPRNVLAKHYTSQGIRLLREIYDKAKLKVLYSRI